MIMNRQQLREKMRLAIYNNTGGQYTQEAEDKAVADLDHLIDEYVAWVIGEDEDRYTADESAKLYRIGDRNKLRAEQRRRAGIGGEQDEHAEKLDKVCPECGQVFRRITEHLKIKHGYYWKDDRLVAP